LMASLLASKISFEGKTHEARACEIEQY
jgi:hypothetical protein